METTNNEVWFIVPGTDGKLYRVQECVKLTYVYTLPNKDRFNQWLKENAIESITHRVKADGSVVFTLLSKYKPLPFTKPYKGNLQPIQTADAARKEILSKLCIEYECTRQEGFRVIEEPYVQKVW